MTLRLAPAGPWSHEATPGLDAEADREMLKSALIVGCGIGQIVVDPNDLLITASGTPDGNVHPGAGQCFIAGTQGANQGSYHISNDSTPVNIPTVPGVATGIRQDLVGIQMRDTEYGVGTFDDGAWFYVAGTPGTGLDPTPPVNSIVLARITWPAANSSICLGSYITDLRPLGQWTTFTPTWATGSGSPNIGSTGTLTGRYRLIGKTLQFRIFFQIQGSGNNGGVGLYTFSLPAGMVGSSGFGEQIVHCELVSTAPTAGTRRILGVGIVSSGASVILPIFPRYPVVIAGEATTPDMTMTQLNQNTAASGGFPILSATVQPIQSASIVSISGVIEIN